MTPTRYHIFLSHGRDSHPNARKMQALKAVADAFDGVTTAVLDHQVTKDPAERLTHMAAAIENAGASPDRIILAGSSMGGWVCAQTASEMPVLGCLLLAPALGLPSYPSTSPILRARHSLIVHGWDDEVVPVGPVIETAQAQRVPLLLLPDGHRLSNSMERITGEFHKLLVRCGLSVRDHSPGDAIMDRGSPPHHHN
ncbi:alpha/beta hydrolase family protein [Marinobacter sp. X15-166B]|uniref:alpha/beta hydrolase family protein n=1 Tax=Marinobacter sp. X15-166B TaxID=1897620 RepID=UPI00085CD354|nr:YqiA/YcfP family alpha/beta fold hydrolase [Marinobacter sp. X15-166B]OEY65090.1 alpha/beta hydrolase [Marinobacter sp. X15-166B]